MIGTNISRFLLEHTKHSDIGYKYHIVSGVKETWIHSIVNLQQPEVMCITVVRHMLQRSRSSSLKYSMKFMCYIHEKEIRDYMLILKIVDFH